MLLLLATIARADAVKPADIHVVDGDTIEALGKRIRLVGFDASRATTSVPASSHVRGPPEGRRSSS
jgi:endonuclease YncB( thermonuclease family)